MSDGINGIFLGREGSFARRTEEDGGEGKAVWEILTELRGEGRLIMVEYGNRIR